MSVLPSPFSVLEAQNILFDAKNIGGVKVDNYQPLFSPAHDALRVYCYSNDWDRVLAYSPSSPRCSDAGPRFNALERWHVPDLNGFNDLWMHTKHSNVSKE